MILNLPTQTRFLVYGFSVKGSFFDLRVLHVCACVCVRMCVCVCGWVGGWVGSLSGSGVGQRIRAQTKEYYFG